MRVTLKLFMIANQFRFEPRSFARGIDLHFHNGVYVTWVRHVKVEIPKWGI